MPRNEIEMAPILSAIIEKFGSLESPQYAFVQEAIARKPYAELIGRLSAIADAIREDTDPNDDVSFGFLLTKASEQLFLQLSMVGTFAVLQRVHGTCNELVDPGCPQSEFENSVVKQVEFANVSVVDDAVLKKSVALHQVNAENNHTMVYQALFSDGDTVPWSGQAPASISAP